MGTVAIRVEEDVSAFLQVLLIQSRLVQCLINPTRFVLTAPQMDSYNISLPNKIYFFSRVLPVPKIQPSGRYYLGEAKK